MTFRKIIGPSIIGIVLFLCNVIQAATIQIDGKGSEFKNSEISINSDYAGKVGDFFSLNTGDHRISFWGPREYFYSFVVTVHACGVQIKEHRTEKWKRQIYEISWNKPKVVLKSKEKQSYEINLTNPVFGKKMEFVRTPEAVMMGCNQQYAILNVTSNPIGGEIWVDGRNSNVRTNGAVSATFCERSKTVSVVVRKTGRVNGKKKVPVSPDANFNVDFVLLKP